MRSPDDKMLDAPKFEQAGIDLLLRTLRDSTQPVEIVSIRFSPTRRRSHEP